MNCHSHRRCVASRGTVRLPGGSRNLSQSPLGRYETDNTAIPDAVFRTLSATTELPLEGQLSSSLVSMATERIVIRTRPSAHCNLAIPLWKMWRIQSGGRIFLLRNIVAWVGQPLLIGHDALRLSESSRTSSPTSHQGKNTATGTTHSRIPLTRTIPEMTWPAFPPIPS